MGEFAYYIWSSYAAAALVLAAITALTLLRHKKTKKTYEALQMPEEKGEA